MSKPYGSLRPLTDHEVSQVLREAAMRAELREIKRRYFVGTALYALLLGGFLWFLWTKGIGR